MAICIQMDCPHQLPPLPPLCCVANMAALLVAEQDVAQVHGAPPSTAGVAMLMLDLSRLISHMTHLP